MKITQLTFKNYSQDEIFDASQKGELVIDGINFIQKIILSIIQGIQTRKSKMRARIDALEQNESRLLARLEILEAKLNVEPKEEHLFPAVADNSILEAAQETAAENQATAETEILAATISPQENEPETA